MADAASAYTISVVVDSDASGLSSGAADAAEAVAGLSENVAAAGGAITDSLDSAATSATTLATTTETASTGAATALDQVPAAASEAASGVSTSTADIESSIEDIANTATDTAQSVDQSLATDIPDSGEAAAVGLTSKAGKFKAVGAQLGTELSSGIGEGIGGREAAAGLANSLSGLLALSAKGPIGIVAAAGFGLGAALIQNLIKGTDDKSAEVAEEFGKIFDSIDVLATDTARSIRNKMFQAFDFRSAVEDIGGGDFDAGLQKLEDVADAAGIKAGQVLEYYQRGITPATKEWGRAVQGVANQEALVLDIAKGDILTTTTEIQQKAIDIVTAAKDNKDVNQEVLDGKRLELSFTRQQVTAEQERLQIAQDFAAALADGATAAQGIATGIANAAASMSGNRWLYRFTH